MKSYLVVDIQVTDPDAYEQYRAVAQEVLKDLGGGGEIMLRGGVDGSALTETLEGDWMPERFVVIEFPSRKAARAFYFSDRYQAALKIRLAASVSKAILVTP